MKSILLFLFGVSLCCLAQNKSVTGSGSEGKLYTYKETDKVKREMEIFFPEGHTKAENPVPGIIFFHGGGWRGGSRKVFSDQCDYFAKRGIVAATVTYRLVSKKDKAKMKDGESPKRLCIPDAKSAIRWFKKHAEELGVDPDRIILAGGSAGGHIGLIASHNPSLNDPNEAKDLEGIDTSVAAYVLFNPALTLGDSSDKEIDFIQHLKPGTSPAIAFFGDKDKWLKGWTPAYKKWQKLNNTSIELQIAKGQGHAFFNKQPWKDLTLLAADEFLVKQGFLKGKPTLRKPEGGKKLELDSVSSGN